MSALITAVVFAVALQSGAGSQPKPDIETIVRDDMSNIDTARQSVARTEGEWALLWKDHAGAKPAPKIDFTRRMAVAVCLGSRSSAGYAVEVTGATQAAKALVIQWREERPKPGTATAQVITSPCHFVTLPKFDGVIQFEKVDR